MKPAIGNEKDSTGGNRDNVRFRIGPVQKSEISNSQSSHGLDPDASGPYRVGKSAIPNTHLSNLGRSKQSYPVKPRQSQSNPNAAKDNGSQDHEPGTELVGQSESQSPVKPDASARRPYLGTTGIRFGSYPVNPVKAKTWFDRQPTWGTDELLQIAKNTNNMVEKTADILAILIPQSALQ